MNITVMLVIAGIVLTLVVWYVPQLQTRSLKSLPVQERFDRTNEARKTIAQILGGAVLLVGFYFNWRGQNETANSDLENQKSSLVNQSIARDSQVTDAFTKAIEHLGNKSLEVQLGGIFGLERLSQEQAMNHWTVMEVLTAYVRTHSQVTAPFKIENSRPRPKTDIQSVMDVLGRRKFKDGDQWLDLRGAELAGSNLWGGKFAHDNFSGADLQFADLGHASLKESTLIGTHLERASLEGTCLNGTDLSTTHIDPDKVKRAWWDNSTKFPPGLDVGSPSIAMPDYCK